MSRRRKQPKNPPTATPPEARLSPAQISRAYALAAQQILASAPPARPSDPPSTGSVSRPAAELAEVQGGKIMWHGVPSQADGEVDFADRLSRSGIPSYGGVVSLEKHPDLSSFSARGLGSQPGLWWDLRNTPEVAAPLKRMSEIIGTSPLRLDRPEMPPHATETDHLMAGVQFDLASRWFWEWQRNKEEGLSSWVDTVLQVAPVCGFLLGEIVAEEKTYTLGGGAEITCLAPSAPQSIMPWAVRYWVLEEGRWAGTIFDFSQSADYGGDRGGYCDYIPSEKLIRARYRPLANNPEGESIMRPIFQQIQQLRMLYNLQALGAEVHALGELWLVQEPGSGSLGSTNAGGVGDEAVAALQRMLVSRAAQYVPGSILPPGMSPVYGQANSNLPNLTPMIENLRQAISLAMGSDDLLIAFQSAGSYAAKKEASVDKNKSLEALVEILIAKPLEDLLARFLSLAFPDSDIWAPRVIWGDVAERDTSAWLDNVSKAKAAGLLDDPEIGPLVRDELGLPQRQDQGGGA